MADQVVSARAVVVTGRGRWAVRQAETEIVGGEITAMSVIRYFFKMIILPGAETLV